ATSGAGGAIAGLRWPAAQFLRGQDRGTADALLTGTGGGTRTPTLLRAADFESAASTIPPLRRGTRIIACVAQNPPCRAIAAARAKIAASSTSSRRRIVRRRPSSAGPGRNVGSARNALRQRRKRTVGRIDIRPTRMKTPSLAWNQGLCR